MATEARMFSPVPRKAPQTLCSAPTSPYPESNIDLTELQSSRPIWYDTRDEATQDLHEVFSCENDTKSLQIPGWIKAFEPRSGSAASTSATATPNHWYFSQISSPEHGLETPSDFDGAAFGSLESPTRAQCDGLESPAEDRMCAFQAADSLAHVPAHNTAAISHAFVPGTPSPPQQRMTRPFCLEGAAVEMATADTGCDWEDVLESPECPPSAQKSQCPPGALDKTSWLQARKVFVGGIPQSMDQNGLYQKFSKLGKVKKAWLQLKHSDQDGNKGSSAKQHRGFGFVIFYDKQVIDAVLGDHESRFIRIDSDLQVEVKRAFGKNGNEPSPNTQAKQPQTKAPVALPAHRSSQGESLEVSGLVAVPTALQTSFRDAVPAQTCSSPASQPGIPIAWASPVVVFTFPCVPAFPFPTPAALAPVPQFPFGGAGAVQQPVGTFTTPLMERPQNKPPQPPCRFVQKPPENQALAQALLQAMPDHYED